MIYIGTAGYSYRDWIGTFYPKDIKQNKMLEYYCLHLNFVEVNSSYYHMPGLKLFESMNKKTPDGFKFSVKLFGGFTHEKNIGKPEAEQFKYAIRPIIETGKLICLLAQFPYSFHLSSENMDYLKRIREWFEGIDINVEFRNSRWINGEVFALLKEQDLGFVCVDEPRIKGLVADVTYVTSRVAYVRMHGRNAEKWYAGQGSERYDYFYGRDELLEWASKIKDIEGRSAMTVVSFNNHPMGKAVENAKALMEILKA